MLERFDDEARGILLGAQPLAAGLRHASVETSHILLSMLAKDECDPTQLLMEHGVSYDSACFVVETIALQSERVLRPTHNKAEFLALIHDAAAMAEDYGKIEVTPMLMLCTLVANPFSRVSQVLARTGANRHAVLGMAQAIIKRS